MQEKKAVSNDVCAAGLHQFIAVAANILYLLKGDLGSFLAQSRSLSRSNIESIYYLHTKANIPEALEDIGRIQVGTKDLIMKSEYPEAVKSTWLKFVLFFEDFLKGIMKHAVCSGPQEYIESARKLLDVVNSFQELTGSFSTSVELIAVREELKQGLSHLHRFENVFAATHKLAQDCGFITDQIPEQKK